MFIASKRREAAGRYLDHAVEAGQARQTDLYRLPKDGPAYLLKEQAFHSADDAASMGQIEPFFWYVAPRQQVRNGNCATKFIEEWQG
jgi:hypothetical protein